MSERVTIFLATYSTSGVPRITLTLAGGFAARGFQVDLVLICGTLPDFEREALPDAVHIIELHKARVAAALPTLIRYLRNGLPKAVVAAEEHLNIVVIVAVIMSRVSSRISVSFHVAPELEASKSLWHKGRWISILGHWLFPRADAVIAISSGMADALARNLRLPRECILVIHNPVVTDSLYDKMEQRPAPDIDRNSGFILSVGRLAPGKGNLDLIDAFGTMRDECDLDLVILGEGVDRPNLEDRVRSLRLEDRVFLPGATKNPFAWMARAKVFVLASYFEGLSNVLIEAMACGCPVVSTDCPSGPNEILDDGRYGELVPMRDPAALADAMTRTLDDPLDAEIIKTRAMDFHVDRILDQYLDALGLKADGSRQSLNGGF